MLNERLQTFASICTGAMLISFYAAATDAQDAKSSSVPPLEIAREGWLYAGGHLSTSIADHPMIGQIYAEYQIPEHLKHPFPVVMIHGGSQNGTNFTGTPDGREGWSQFFLREGYAVYVVDQAGRGRAAYSAQAYGPLRYPSVNFTQQRFTDPEAYNMWPQAHLHTQWPGTGKPGDPTFDAFFASQEPSIADFAEQQSLMQSAGGALLDKIGPTILLVHSQSGAFAWPIAQARPKLVRAILAVEPSGPPVHDVIDTGPPGWFKDDPKVKISGLGNIPLQYDPPLAPDEHLEFQLAAAAKGPDLAVCWSQKEPARKLVALDKIPLLIITSEASYHAPYDDCTVAYLRQAGVHVDDIHLPDTGIHGNGHMMMLEQNNLQIAAVMTQWLDKQNLQAPNPQKN
ncbi:MAG TPA: alpha/beta hydrolase [Xanthobacteraceae bacterium]|jgi:pimeloyl-ACP methyl ester carboxylesterase